MKGYKTATAKEKGKRLGDQKKGGEEKPNLRGTREEGINPSTSLPNKRPDRSCNPGMTHKQKKLSP